MARDPATLPESAAEHLAAVDRPPTVTDEPLRWGSDAVAAMVRALGIPYIALNPGASYRGLHDSLVNVLGNRDPQMLVCLHEEHAVAIAHGYAKATGRLIVNGTSAGHAIRLSDNFLFAYVFAN